MFEYPSSRIRRVVADECAKGEVVDVNNLARLIHPFCPEQTHEQLVEMILAEVALARGNARWGPVATPPRAANR